MLSFMLCYPSMPSINYAVLYIIYAMLSSMLSFLMYTCSSYLLSSSALLQYQAKPSNWREDLEDQPTRGQGYKGETSPGTEYFPIYFMINLTFLIYSMTSSLSSLLYSKTRRSDGSFSLVDSQPFTWKFSFFT